MRRGALGKLWGCHSPVTAIVEGAAQPPECPGRDRTLSGHKVTGTMLWPLGFIQKRNIFQQSPTAARVGK